MSNVSQWSTTAASNNSAPPNGWPEGMAPSDVNNCAREMMASLAKWYSDSDGTLTSGGSSNAYTLTTNSTHAALADMPLVVFKANHANTGAATLAVDGLTAKDIKKNHDVALASGDIEANQICICVYNATDDTYELVSQTAQSSTELVDDTTPQLGGFLDPNSNYIGMGKGGDIASASPLVVDTDGDYFDVTGTTGFAAMTVAANRHFFLQFDGVLTMTHHATNLDLPGEADITTAAGDVAEFVSTGANTVQCVNYTKADGTAVVGSGGAWDVIIEEQQTSGTDGGTFTNGADRIRVLNTLVLNVDTIASLSSNQFTLGAGTYDIEWSAPGYSCDFHQSFLYDVTNTTEIKRGESSEARANEVQNSRSAGATRVTIAGSTAYEIRHRCGATRSTDGLGQASSFGTEVYTWVRIKKVGS